MDKQEEQFYEEDSIDIKKYIKLIWDGKKFITIWTSVITLLAVVYVLVVAETFKSTVTILPDNPASKFASSGLGDLAIMAGVAMPSEGSLLRLYPQIIKSEVVLKDIVYKKFYSKKYNDSINLIKFWEIMEKSPEKDYEVAIKNLREIIKVNLDTKSSLLTLDLEMEEPQLTADILNSVLSSLDKFVRTKKSSTAGNQREFIEERLIIVKEDLSNAENRLKNFREQNRMIVTSPELLLEQERLAREVVINTTLYIELKKQFELAKIEEVKNIPVINVLDKARASAVRENPKRRNIVMLAFFVGLFAVTVIEIFRKSFTGFGFLRG